MNSFTELKSIVWNKFALKEAWLNKRRELLKKTRKQIISLNQPQTPLDSVKFSSLPKQTTTKQKQAKTMGSKPRKGSVEKTRSLKKGNSKTVLNEAHGPERLKEEEEEALERRDSGSNEFPAFCPTDEEGLLGFGSYEGLPKFIDETREIEYNSNSIFRIHEKKKKGNMGLTSEKQEEAMKKEAAFLMSGEKSDDFHKKLLEQKNSFHEIQKSRNFGTDDRMKRIAFFMDTLQRKQTQENEAKDSQLKSFASYFSQTQKKNLMMDSITRLMEQEATTKREMETTLRQTFYAKKIAVNDLSSKNIHSPEKTAPDLKNKSQESIKGGSILISDGEQMHFGSTSNEQRRQEDEKGTSRSPNSSQNALKSKRKNENGIISEKNSKEKWKKRESCFGKEKKPFQNKPKGPLNQTEEIKNAPESFRRTINITTNSVESKEERNFGEDCPEKLLRSSETERKRDSDKPQNEPRSKRKQLQGQNYNEESQWAPKTRKKSQNLGSREDLEEVKTGKSFRDSNGKTQQSNNRSKTEEISKFGETFGSRQSIGNQIFLPSIRKSTKEANPQPQPFKLFQVCRTEESQSETKISLLKKNNITRNFFNQQNEEFYINLNGKISRKESLNDVSKKRKGKRGPGSRAMSMSKSSKVVGSQHNMFRHSPSTKYLGRLYKNSNESLKK